MKRVVINHYPRSMRDDERVPPLKALTFMLAVRLFLKDERGAWFVALLIGLALNIIAYLLLPKPKTEKPPAAQEGDNPTALAGIPIPKIVGTVIVKELNVLDYRDKGMLTYTVDV